MPISFTPISANRKTGPIPTTMSDRITCPTTCPFYDKGCYAKSGVTNIHWSRVTRGIKGYNWTEFLSKIKSIRLGSLWRHNVAGDLPHQDGIIDGNKVAELVDANRGHKGYTYTHHELNETNIGIIKFANASGFTINASTEDVEVADSIMTQHNIPAVAVVKSNINKRFFKTSSGRRVIVCPATIHDNVTCATCGLCQQSNREFIVAFPAHGVAKNIVNSKVA